VWGWAVRVLKKLCSPLGRWLSQQYDVVIVLLAFALCTVLFFTLMHFVAPPLR
jgi:hypothetical protein